MLPQQTLKQSGVTVPRVTPPTGSDPTPAAATPSGVWVRLAGTPSKAGPVAMAMEDAKGATPGFTQSAATAALG